MTQEAICADCGAYWDCEHKNITATPKGRRYSLTSSERETLPCCKHLEANPSEVAVVVDDQLLCLHCWLVIAEGD